FPQRLPHPLFWQALLLAMAEAAGERQNRLLLLRIFFSSSWTTLASTRCVPSATVGPHHLTCPTWTPSRMLACVSTTPGPCRNARRGVQPSLSANTRCVPTSGRQSAPMTWPFRKSHLLPSQRRSC